jgi:hypothetical protein
MTGWGESTSEPRLSGHLRGFPGDHPDPSRARATTQQIYSGSIDSQVFLCPRKSVTNIQKIYQPALTHIPILISLSVKGCASTVRRRAVHLHHNRTLQPNWDKIPAVSGYCDEGRGLQGTGGRQGYTRTGAGIHSDQRDTLGLSLGLDLLVVLKAFVKILAVLSKPKNGCKGYSDG